MLPHYWLGYAIGGLVLAHAWVSMSAGFATHVDATGLYLATGALVLIILQVAVGLRLRERGRRNHRQLRRLHFFTMVAILTTAAAHIVLDSAVAGLARALTP
jgi:hypothetical protein